MPDIIDSRTLKQWLQDQQELALFDIREAGQFGEGHLFFAVPLPYSRLEIDVVKLAPREEVRVVLVGQGDDGDSLALLAAQRLETLGYSQVHVLVQGVQGWQAAGFSLFKGVNVPSKTFGELVEHAYGTPHISARELQAWRLQGRQFALLDGRTLEEHHKMTIPGAVGVPNGELGYRVHTLVPDPAMPIVINCAGRTRSILGAQTLRNLELPNPVVALENGTQGWMLAGLQLEHGSTARYAAVSDEPADLEQARRAAAQLRRRFEIPLLGSTEAQAWIDDPRHSTFVFDIRTAEEFAARTLPGAVHAPGGQLIQATDQYLGVRNSRLILLDHEAVRAPIVASWLYQLGFTVALLEQGIDTPLRLPLAPAAGLWPAADLDRLQVLRERQDLRLIDIRSSAAFRQAHVEAAEWSIRPLLRQQFGNGNESPVAVLLIADDASSAALAAVDLHEAGVREIDWTAGLAALEHAGYALQRQSLVPRDEERIDYLFFVHDRHAGNRAAAEQYLAWETGLIGQCSADELAGFRLPRTHFINRHEMRSSQKGR